MKSTKERILDVALDLMNQEGIANMSMRKLANALDISPGNLTYHYKRKEHIQEALFVRLVGEMDQIYIELNSSKINKEILTKMSALLFDNIYKYRCVFIDFVHLVRKNKNIGDQYYNLMKLREAQFIEFYKYLESIEITIPKSHDEIILLHERLHIISDYFLSSLLLRRINLNEAKNRFLKQIESLTGFYLK